MHTKKTPKEENRMTRTPGDVVRDFFNVGKVKRMFRVGSDLMGAIVPLVEHRTPWNAAKAAFMVGKIIVDDLEIWPDDYFNESWDCPYPQDFNKIIHSALINKPYKIIRTSDETVTIYMVQLEDVQVGYILNTKTGLLDRIYVESDKVERTKELIKRELWRTMKDDNVVLRYVKNSKRADYEGNVALEVDDAFRPMPSQRAEEYSRYLRKCVDAGVSRSVMLYGPPGTGKSTMARTIVASLGMKSFRIRVEDIGHMESSSIFEAINIFEPDAVILDDFDRSGSQESLLETLEFFQRHVKLVIATVNDKNKLDEAILRPGRFDELLHIKQMDGDVVRSVLGDEHAAAYDTVKDWPIAFIQEYVKRLRFMTPEEAQSSTKELASRVQRLTKYDSEEEEDGVSKVINSNKHVGSSFDDFLKESGIKVRKRKRSQ